MPLTKDLAYRQKKHQAYLHALCTRYVNQFQSPFIEIDVQIQEIKPLINKLVGCAFYLNKYLVKVEEVHHIYQNIKDLNQKDFYEWMYERYGHHVDNKLMSKMGALETLFYGLLLRDFYTGDFEKIALGGNVAPILLDALIKYDNDEEYDVVCHLIYFPAERIPFINDCTVQRLIENPREKVTIPNQLDKQAFKTFFDENLTEIIDTLNNLRKMNREEEVEEIKVQNPNEVTPSSWVKTYMALTNENTRPQTASLKEKKVSFGEVFVIEPPPTPTDYNIS